ncbi:hypothetical protein KJ359_000952 [Pestalotiopsis sp. 9143b]|nr:hypothetical protein KJ359_000952 [Pestalotiopsis sp. 9143b]
MGVSISYHIRECQLDLGEKGAIKGLQYDNKSRRYAGIPYALPPTGEYRWRKPRPLPASYRFSAGEDKPFDATKFKPACPQGSFSANPEQGGDATFSEDCLVMNIWTPVPKDGAKVNENLPVLLWLHGGWFQLGDPSQDKTMDPTEMISTGGMNAIVVAIGYRLNIFGFLASEELREESGGASAGNFGLWDQRLAIEWVKENIALFGGDPENITLGGRSAGSYGVEAQVLHEFRGAADDEQQQSHLLSKEAQLFHRFYMISNAIPAQPKTVPETQPQFDEVCAYFDIPSTAPGAEKLARLRARRAGMRVLIGEVRNEETLYATYNAPAEPTAAALRLQVGNYYAPATTERILEHYALPEKEEDLEEWRAVFGSIIADGQVRAPSRGLAHHLHRHGVPLADIWRYQVAKRLSFITEKVAPASFGVSHAMDKPWWNFSIQHGPTPKEMELMEEWLDILIAFAHDDRKYDFGTRAIDEFKVVTADNVIEIQQDTKWAHLVKLSEIFASD